MKKSEYAELYERILKAAMSAGGVDVPTLAREAGSSRQRAYTWIAQNRDRLEVLGRTDTGGELFAMAADAKPRKYPMRGYAERRRNTATPISVTAPADLNIELVDGLEPMLYVTNLKTNARLVITNMQRVPSVGIIATLDRGDGCREPMLIPDEVLEAWGVLAGR